jgi:hypothetical protein
MVSCSSSSPAKADYGDSYYSESSVLYDESPRRSSETDDRMVAYTASLQLIVKNTDETRKALLDEVKNNRGYIVREADDYITARIPAENMDNFLQNSKTLGKVVNESKTGTDITDQYRDNVLRLDNLKNVRARYLALLNRANTVAEILSIEKELERVNMEIERLEGRIQYAAQSVAYSNITIRFKENAKPGPVGWIFYGLYRGILWLFIWN